MLQNSGAFRAARGLEGHGMGIDLQQLLGDTRFLQLVLVCLSMGLARLAR
ncbi:MAG: hypothetical protein ACREQY_23675 [Candidatus Binatia bacterium]